MLDDSLISVDEFYKLTAINRETFSGFLWRNAYEEQKKTATKPQTL
ncbi:MAG: hypothetical protein LKK27_07220 [Eubacterium sp.]|jgi:hypothetical protein|nr:hypothetical protein [Eubacterium sp.]